MSTPHLTSPRTRGEESFRALAWATVVALYGQIVLGGVVRVTGSGEACNGWPLCSGHLVPAFDSHVLIEYSHRTVGFIAICLVIATAVVALLVRQRARALQAWALVTVGLVLVQAVLGGITVLLHLPPTAILLHLGNAMLVLASALVVALSSGRAQEPVRTEVTLGTRSAILAGAVAAFAVVLSGAYVVGAGASSACTSWPLCGVAGGSADVHMLHRVLVAVASVILVWAAVAGFRRWRETSLRVAAVVIVLALIVEVLVGREQVLSGLPESLRAIHLALATLIWACAFTMLAALRLEAGSLLPARGARRQLSQAGAR